MKRLLLIFLFPFYLIIGAESITILAPSTPSSIPLILSAQQEEKLEIKLFQQHSKAHSKFLQEKADILVTGLTVGRKFYDQEIPVKIINTYVSELSYLITAEDQLSSFSDLKGQEIYLPFKGAPLTEVTKFFTKQENLKWKEEVNPRYSPFPSTVKLLLRGKAKYAVLPEPFVSQILSQKENIKISFSYTTLWNNYTGETDGFPQVATFIKSDNKNINRQIINLVNEKLKESITYLQSYPDSTINRVENYFDFSGSVLKSSLNRTGFTFYTGEELKNEIKEYYQKIENPLDKTYKDFFLNHKK